MTTNLAKKLQIKPGHRVLVVNGSKGFEQELGELPDGAELTNAGAGEFDNVIAFFTKKTDFDARASELKKSMGEKGILWVCYPKGTAKVETDLNRDILRNHAEDRYKLQGVSLIAVDDTWSAMRLKKV